MIQKNYSFPQRSIDTWNGLKEGDNGKECTSTEGKTGQI